MIWKKDFEKIDFVVKRAVDDFYLKLKENKDYIFFLAYGDYIMENEKTNFSPYVIDYRIDGFKDEAWIEVLMTFLNSAYSFTNENTADSKVSIFFETMLYIHIWESRPYLRFLKRATNLIEGKPYLWKLNINDPKKSGLLEQGILPKLKKKKLQIVDIINNAYIKQIRDAIAHNEYWHSWSRPVLIFENNNKKNPNSIDELHYNEWTEIFSKTFLLAFYLRKQFEEEKKKLDDKKCIEGFEVKLPTIKNGEVDGLIFYDKIKNKFRAKIIK
jgi:hypothetical protein